MSLASIDLEGLARELRAAAVTEMPGVAELRRLARQLSVQELGYRQCIAVAPVATDGGENRLSFEPLNIEIIRVADSEGNEHLQKCVPLSGDPNLFQKFFEEIPLLRMFLDRLGIAFSELSTFLPARALAPSGEGIGLRLPGEDLRRFVRAFRDIAEWAVLLDLASSGRGVKMLVIRDGLLRTVSLTPRARQALADAFERANRETGAMLVGVAKRSKVLSYLSLALTLEGVLARSCPCFCEVPRELEEACYRDSGPWIQGHAIGTMHLAKLADGRDTPVFPVDIPSWLLPRRKEVLEYLAETARASFPLPGYPQPLVEAHEAANLGGLEMAVLSDLLVRAVAESMTGREAEQVVRHVAFGRGLVQGGVNRDG